jgi:hypothetical protein
VSDPGYHTFVDLSGYAFTGKHAVIDLMREVQGCHVEPFDYEFALLRIQGGILDLEHALCDDWSPIRSDAAIRRFARLIRRLGTANSWRHPRSWFEAVGWNYEAHYNHRFFELSRRYLDELLESSWMADWPFALAELGDLELFVRKLGGKLGVPGALHFRMYLARPENFVGATRRYLHDLLLSNVAPGIDTVVLHNAFEPFNPRRSMKFFDRAKAIVVDRDPRDSYVQGLWYSPTRVSPENYVRRHRIYRAAVRSLDDADVLRIRFEDLVLDYDRVVDRIFTHLGFEPSRHVRRRQHFDPAVSRKNVGLWKKYHRQDEIDLIHRELAEYCCDYA